MSMDAKILSTNANRISFGTWDCPLKCTILPVTEFRSSNITRISLTIGKRDK